MVHGDVHSPPCDEPLPAVVTTHAASVRSRNAHSVSTRMYFKLRQYSYVFHSPSVLVCISRGAGGGRQEGAREEE